MKHSLIPKNQGVGDNTDIVEMTTTMGMKHNSILKHTASPSLPVTSMTWKKEKKKKEDNLK